MTHRDNIRNPDGRSMKRLLAVGLLAAGLFAVAVFVHGGAPIVQAQTLNGFDLSNRLIPLSEIHRGGPPRDGIPALTDPEFVSAQDAHGLHADDRVLGVHRNGVAKAYPLGIMNYHEVVNDLFGNEPIAVTYCPLCFTGIAFRAGEPDGSRRLFGVSGLLYNSDVLLYDQQTESLWSRIAAQAITGPRRGETLETIPAANTTWGVWRAEHPESLVLSRNTQHARNYDRMHVCSSLVSPAPAPLKRVRDGRLAVGRPLSRGGDPIARKQAEDVVLAQENSPCRQGQDHGSGHEHTPFRV